MGWGVKAKGENGKQKGTKRVITAETHKAQKRGPDKPGPYNGLRDYC